MSGDFFFVDLPKDRRLVLDRTVTATVELAGAQPREQMLTQFRVERRLRRSGFLMPRILACQYQSLVFSACRQLSRAVI